MLNLLSVHVYTVIVVFGVHDETAPLPPARWNISALVLVQVFSKISSSIAHIREVRGKRFGLVRCLPISTGAVVVVRKHVMVVHVHPCQDTGTGWTTHGSGGVGVSELSPIISQEAHGAWHKAQRAQFYVLVVGQN